MNKRATFFLSFLFVSFAVGITASADTTFTYQGELKQNGGLANGSFSMDFSLWNAFDGGNQIGSTDAQNGVQVVDGKFAVDLDFGANSFNNGNRWLEISVGGFTLSPRNAITRSPYSVQTRGIFVDNDGHVGIGTISPSSSARMTVNSVGIGQPPHAIKTASNTFSLPTIQATNVNAGPVLWADGSSDVEPQGGGVVVIGQHDDFNLAIDRNEIMARFDGAPSQLLLNFDGGDTQTGGRLGVGVEPLLAQLTVRDTDPGAGFGIHVQSTHNVLPTIFAENENGGPVLWADGVSDVSLGGGGVLVVGQESDFNIAVDRNEIMARNDGQASALYLNGEGGEVRMGEHNIAPAFAYARVDFDGTVLSSSSNVEAVVKVGEGRYLIDLENPPMDSDVMIASGQAICIVRRDSETGNILVQTFLSAGSFVDSDFSLVVYRP